MEVGFFFWPFDPALVRRMAEAAERWGFDLIGVADTPGNAMDPWVAATMVAERTGRARIALCVTNLESRHPAATAAAAASLDLLAPGRIILGLGTGHSGTRNIGLGRTGMHDLASGAGFIRALLRGEKASWRGGEAHLPWVARPSPVFLSASGPRALAIAASHADGAFVNYGLRAENLAQTGAALPETVETWQIAALDCHADAAAARARVGAILAFMAAGYILRGDLAGRGVPAELHGAVAELRRRYSTRPGAADAALVDELGLFDYLAARFAIFGTPARCLAQMEAARAAGLRRVMFTVSLAADPAGTVELFGREVLPALRG
ncbi:MAG TPA: LLM class flavin-dependent oxidoreductase [Stellaceae bacterium]|nr:LLM class flavin-dependent oxidoreductase [Stellaceae bacterium]